MKSLKMIGLISCVMVFFVGCKAEYSDDPIGITIYEFMDDELELTTIIEKDDNFDQIAIEKEIIEGFQKSDEEHVGLRRIHDYGDKIGVAIRFDSITDYRRIFETRLYHDTLEDYLDNLDTTYDAFEDEDLLYNVLDNTEISEGQLKSYEDDMLIKIDCGPANVVVEGDVLFASKGAMIKRKDTVYFDESGTYYILYKPSSGISRWILWALLLSIVLYASFLGMKRLSNKKEDRICGTCGQKNDDDAIYCKLCGEKIDELVEDTVDN